MDVIRIQLFQNFFAQNRGGLQNSWRGEPSGLLGAFQTCNRSHM